MAANKLFDALGEQLLKSDIARFKGLLHNSPLSPVKLENCTTFSEICQELVDGRKILPDENDFEILKDLFRQMNKMTLVDMITKHERAHGKGQAASGHTVVEHSPAGKTLDFADPANFRNDGRGHYTSSMTAEQADTGAQGGAGNQQGPTGSSEANLEVNQTTRNAGSAGDGNEQRAAGRSDTSQSNVQVHQTGSAQGAGNFQNVRVGNMTINQTIYQGPAPPTEGPPED